MQTQTRELSSAGSEHPDIQSGGSRTKEQIKWELSSAGSEHPDIQSGGSRTKEQIKWELSSAGSEHLPYKQGVTGSNPVAPTNTRPSAGVPFLNRCITCISYIRRGSTATTSAHARTFLNGSGATIPSTGASPEKPTIGTWYTTKSSLPRLRQWPANVK